MKLNGHTYSFEAPAEAQKIEDRLSQITAVYKNKKEKRVELYREIEAFQPKENSIKEDRVLQCNQPAKKHLTLSPSLSSFKNLLDKKKEVVYERLGRYYQLYTDNKQKLMRKYSPIKTPLSNTVQSAICENTPFSLNPKLIVQRKSCQNVKKTYKELDANEFLRALSNAKLNKKCE